MALEWDGSLRHFIHFSPLHRYHLFRELDTLSLCFLHFEISNHIDYLSHVLRLCHVLLKRLRLEHAFPCTCEWFGSHLFFIGWGNAPVGLEQLEQLGNIVGMCTQGRTLNVQVCRGNGVLLDHRGACKGALRWGTRGVR
jgi:hypothetical protein